MDEFDRRLRDRLQRLEAAVPAPAVPTLITPRRSTWWRLGAGLVLAALALGSVAAAVVLSSPDPRVEAADEARRAREEQAFFEAYDSRSHADCPTVGQAKAEAKAILDRLGLDWTIRDDGRYRDAPCVGMAAIGDAREVLLMPSMGRVVADGLDRLKEKMLKECLSRDAAIEYVATFLRNAGVPEPQVEAGGMFIVPNDPILADALEDHRSRGCYVYNNAQFDQHGRYTWYIAGE